MCAWSTKSEIPYPDPKWQNDTNFASILYYSDDGAATWKMADIIATTNECAFSLLPDKRLLLLGRAQSTPLSFVIFDPELSTHTPLQKVQGLLSPVCEGSLVSGHPQGPGSGYLFYSNPSSSTWRGNLSIHSSIDGVHWDQGFEVWGEQSHRDTNSGYSALLARQNDLALLFEGGEEHSPHSWPDTWIRFTTIPYNMIITDRCSTQNQIREARQWTVVELNFQAELDVQDPFDLDTGFFVIFNPSQKSESDPMRVRGFWDGGRTWKIRWSAPMTGCWSWHVECLPFSRGEKVLCNRTGSIRILPPLQNETNMLRRHGGFLHASNQSSTGGRSILTYTDGTPFFYLGDTWWRAPSHYMPLENFTKAANKRREQGYTVVQVHGGSGFWPRICIGANNCSGVNCTQAVDSLNITFFQREDPYYEIAEQNGLLLVVGRLIGDKLAQVPNADRVLPKLFTYMMARWGAYPVTFLFTQEYNVLYYGWTNITLLLQQGIAARNSDPWKRSLTMHPAVLWKDTRDAWPYNWYEFVMIQEGHLTSTSGKSLRNVYKAARGMPCVNGEANYEGFLRKNVTIKNETGYLNCSEIVNAACVRDSAWVTMQSGFGGFTYGAQGLYAIVQNVSDPGPTAMHGPVLTWEQGLALPGGSQMRYFKKFYTQVVQNWWQFTPWPPFGDSVFVSYSSIQTAFVLYSRPRPVPCTQSGEILIELNITHVPNNIWDGVWFDPRTGIMNSSFVLTGTSNHTLLVPSRSDTSCRLDWTILLSPHTPANLQQN